MKSHFNLSRQQRRGVLGLLTIILGLQVAAFVYNNLPAEAESNLKLNMVLQAQLDSLKAIAVHQKHDTIYPFNPNYVSDYKGYVLGLTPLEIDRLKAYRSQGHFINTKEAFQKVTQISDSLMQRLAPSISFPNWTTKPSRKYRATGISHQEKPATTVIDLNTVTKAQLMTINGIGEKLSTRILKFRNRLGGFVVNEQLYDVYGLTPEVVQRTLAQFQVLQPPEIDRININVASIEELATLVYLGYDLAEKIVAYREDHGAYRSFDDLFNVVGFSVNKQKRIALYLSY
ncbi:MAG: helix-hairpin-helix domain-containing protein [Bacteroidota bacterium]